MNFDKLTFDYFSILNNSGMKYRILTIFIIVVGSVHGQKVSIVNKLKAKQFIQKGNQEFYNGLTMSGFMSYKQAIMADPTNSNAFQSLANVQLELRKYYGAKESAMKAYELAKKKNNPDLNYIKAQAHHRLGEIKEALEHYKVAMKEFPKAVSKDYSIQIKISQCEYALSEKLTSDSNIRKPLAEELSSKNDEYAPILCLNGQQLFFTARRPDTKGNNSNPDDEQFFEDIYHAIWNEETQKYEMQDDTKKINTEGFDALSYASENGRLIYGTVNTAASKESTAASSDIAKYSSNTPLKLSRPRVIDNKEINTTFYEGCPTFTDTLYNSSKKPYQTMVFVSDRQGEKKMTDLYQIDYVKRVWQEVTSLPDYINTTSRETTPFLSPDGNYLFFSSDGLPGFGGYDIYYSKKENGVWGIPKNLGPKFNTVNDDTHFQFYSWGVAVAASIAEVDGEYNYQMFQFDLTELDLPFMK